ncbi:hypothetical protein Scep_001984 [Stephania cephalantha]|uniref:Secreted protein n=1 Tax=Stephania cephalantha TaxID=152367 RepID=A0AAP0Q4J4_9MAGN
MVVTAPLLSAACLLVLSVIFVRHCASPPAARRRLRLRHLRSLSWSLCISENIGDEDAGGFAFPLAPSRSLILLTRPPILISLVSVPSSM